MIDLALGYLVSRLDGHLQKEFEFQGPAVTLATPGKTGAGDSPPEGLILSLLQATRDPSAPHGILQTEVSGTTAIRRLPALALNVQVLLAANFDDRYEEGLAALSSALGFFQANPVFGKDAQTDPLPAPMRKLSIELASLSLQDLTGLWSVMGGRFLPSVVYQLRLVMIDPAKVQRQDGIVQEIGIDLARSKDKGEA